MYNLARMTTGTTGTGTITLGAAVPGFLTFAQAGVANGETVVYGIRDGNNSEVGTGVYTSAGTTLTRTVLKSTNSDSAINLSGAAQVYITALKEQIANLTENNVFSGSGEFNGQLIGVGTATNDNAATGDIGEFVSSEVASGSAVSLTTATAADVTSISLTAGDWDVRGHITINASVTFTVANGWTSTTSATSPSSPNNGSYVGNQATGALLSSPTGVQRLSINSTTTVFLSALAFFSSGTCVAWGGIYARRVR